jgi:hypothetical protein
MVRGVVTPFQQGYDAYYTAISQDDNPYRPGSMPWMRWDDGWDYALVEDGHYHNEDCNEIC